MPHAARSFPWSLLAASLLLGFACTEQQHSARDAAPSLGFVDVTRDAGITHVHHKPLLDPVLEPIMPWVSSVGAAVAVGDFDGDGWVDVYMTQSRRGEPNLLYRNRGDGTFEDVAGAAGVAEVNDDGGISTDCVWGDYDNDGHLDLFVVRWGRDLLFRSRGDGTFEDVSELAFQSDGRPGSPWANGCAAVWVDYDRDGHLDLYVGNYFAPHDLWNLTTTHIMHDSFETARNAGANALYHNQGDGTFREVGAALGVDDPGWTLSVGHGDLNNDGWPDIYSADDFGPDQLFLNRGDGTFANVSEESIGIDTKKGMNVATGDFDGDGWLDVYVTNITTAEYLKEGNMLWHNVDLGADGVPFLMDVSVESGTYDGGWGWGATFFDFDNDADLDLVALNGFISAGDDSYWYDLASWTVEDRDVTDALGRPTIGERSFSGYEPARLWRNDGDVRFTEMAAELGVADTRDGRGVAAFDYDDDGDVDLLFAHQGAAPALYRNDLGGGAHWLRVALEGLPAAGSNRDAVGARVTVVTGERRQIRELDGGNSFSGQSDRRLLFGLADASEIDVVEIRWPSGAVSTFDDVPVDQQLNVRETPDLGHASVWIPTKREGAARLARAPAADEPRESAAERDALLTSLEADVRRALDDPGVASRYRAECVRLGEHERSIRFFRDLAADDTAVPNVRLQLAAAYIDKIPTCGGVAAIVSKGKLARKSLGVLDELLDEDRTWWPAMYSRAMNHLHWPRALRHSDDAAADYRRLIEIQRDAGRVEPYHVRAYVGLGDALVKGGDFDAGRDAWRAGLELFPQNDGLKRRLQLETREAALAFIEDVRSLDRSIDTDFGFLTTHSD